MVARVMSWMMKLSVFCIRRIKSKKMRAMFTVRRRLVGFRQKRPPPSQALISLVPPRTTFPFPTHKFCMNESAGLGTWLLVTSSSPFVSKIERLRKSLQSLAISDVGSGLMGHLELKAEMAPV